MSTRLATTVKLIARLPRVVALLSLGLLTCAWSLGCQPQQRSIDTDAEGEVVTQADSEGDSQSPPDADSSEVITDASPDDGDTTASPDSLDIANPSTTTADAAPPAGGDKPAPAAERRLTGAVVRLGVPRDLLIDDALAMVNTNAFPAGIQGTLKANGIFAGEIQLADVPKFEATLGAIVSSNQRRLLGMRDLTPTPIGDARKQPTQATITQWSNGSSTTRPLRLPPGQPQLLIRSTPTDEGMVDVELVPHYYFPKFSLFPRQPQEKALDGRVFSELTLSHLLSADRLIVLTATPPKARQPTDDEGDAGAGAELEASPDDGGEATESPTDSAPDDAAPTEPGAESAPEAEVEKPGDNAVPAGPPDLGQVFLLGRSMEQPVRYILILGVRDAAPSELRNPPQK